MRRSKQKLQARLGLEMEGARRISFFSFFLIELRPTLVPEAFFYSLLASFATRTASFIYLFFGAESRESFLSALQSALRVANFQIKKIILKESLSDQGICGEASTRESVG